MSGEIKPEELVQLKAGLNSLLELKTELANLRAENTQLRHQLSQQETRLNNLLQGSAGENNSTSRRRMLKKVGAAAASLVAAGVATSAGLQTARATNGLNLIIGSTGNAGESTTLLFYDGANTAGPGSIFITSDIQNVNTSTGFRASVAGHATGTATGLNYGVFGYHGVTVGNPTPAGAGVAGVSDSSNGWGLRAKGGRANLYLEAAGAAPLNRSDAHFKGEVLVDNGGALWSCVGDGMPGTWRKLAGPSTAGSYHFLPTANRFGDTRTASVLNTTAGAIQPGTTKVVTVAGVNGRDAGLQIPLNAAGIVGTIGIITPAGTGTLKVFPGGFAGDPATTGVATTGYFGLGVATAFSAVLGTGANAGKLLVYCGSAATDFVIDITGYYL